jgi:CP family cyanate transporter-like MFS transporter
MFLMGIFAFAGPFLQSRVGARRAVIASLVVLVAGSLLRLTATQGWQMVGTAALLGVGVAIIQAVFPGIVKKQFPNHVGMVMGLYSATLMGGGALGAQAAPLITSAAGDWHVGLAWMAIPAALALVLAAGTLPRDNATGQKSLSATALLRRPRVWLLMACFGLVNGGYSTAVAWLAPFYREHGWSAAAGGSLLAIMAVFQALAALILPMLARSRDLRGWLWLTLAMQAVGFAALAFSPEASPMLWAAILGAGLGGCFSLSMIVALDHLPDPAEAGALSALMQGGGFLITALPPWIVAALHETTGGFTAGWLLHLACAIVVAVLYRRMSPEGYAKAMKPTVPAASPVIDTHVPS